MGRWERKDGWGGRSTWSAVDGMIQSDESEATMADGTERERKSLAATAPAILTVAEVTGRIARWKVTLTPEQLAERERMNRDDMVLRPRTPSKRALLDRLVELHGPAAAGVIRSDEAEATMADETNGQFKSPAPIGASRIRIPPTGFGVLEHGISPSIHVTYQDPATGRITGKRLPMSPPRRTGSGDD